MVHSTRNKQLFVTFTCIYPKSLTRALGSCLLLFPVSETFLSAASSTPRSRKSLSFFETDANARRTRRSSKVLSTNDEA
jgi:hypothetical protein